MATLLNSPGFLLLAVGSLLGITFPLGKMGSEANVPPAMWALVMTAGAAIGLVMLRIGTKQPLLVNIRNTRFYCIAAILSMVFPYTLMFTVIPILGSGFTGLLIALSPIMTLSISSIWQVRLPTRLGLLGILFGFVGAVIVAITRGEIGSPASLTWILAGIAVTASLAVGNVYRTMAWPPDAEPIELAIGVSLAASAMLILMIVVLPQNTDSIDVRSLAPTVLLTMPVSCCYFALHSRLQFVGGPVYLSQLGYVAAAVALAIGTVFFNENYAKLTWIGAVIILFGAGLSIVAQRRQIEAQN